ncbi:MFS transporter [Bifidobacterium avesanii]|uniref:MFS transporter n=1 Tax=Bifidobacterium avesanii TaxID=1798157 RepID=A0A7K3THH6_9BIFI|nr:MFS transporter [Bifidobacterium avesanii]KAB8292641.1 MFS transporter [Bifidobacterium avesanii]NEG78531.1 MFS transporter [Bifidobacterium avesanii]
MSAAPSPYARLFRLPGAKAFCVSAAVARLPISMMSLGIVLALNHLYDNWTVAGTMSASYIFCAAIVTPFYARLFDRFGQRRVGVVALGVQTVVMLGFATGAALRIPIPALFALAVMAGLSQFSFGALVRTRWAYALRGHGDEDSLLNTAYALESAIDEIVFIVGPILAAFLATSVNPVSQLFVPVIAAATGGTVFFSLKGTQPPVMTPVAVEAAQSGAAGRSGARSPRINAPARAKSALLYPGVWIVVVVFVVFNMSFTAFDVSVTANMKAMGLEQFVGLQLAMFAVGSCMGAIVFGSVRFPGSHWKLMVLFLAILTGGFVLFRLAMNHLILLGVLEILAGLVVSPMFATGNLIVKESVPARSLTEGLAWVTTGGSVGASLGSSAAGVVLDAGGPAMGLMLPFLFTGCAVPLAFAGWLMARRRVARQSLQS